jgi:hypothetical protein
MLRVVGAGLPRTATRSLKEALERLLGGRCYHMHEVFQHLEDVPTWRAAVWSQLAAANPDAVIVHSIRESPTEWWESVDATIFQVMRKGVKPEHEEWLEMCEALLVREIGESWDDAGAAQAYYERHNERVRREASAGRLLEWRARDGWEPLCAALGVPVPVHPFPHVNTRAEWTA